MQRFLYTKNRDIKMQWKYVVLQHLVLGPGLGLEPQVLVNITAVIGLSTEENQQQVLWPLTTGNKKKFNIDYAVF